MRWWPSTFARPAWLTAPVVGSKVITLPPLSTAEHWSVDGQETDETMPMMSTALRVRIEPSDGSKVICSPLPSTVVHWLVLGQLTVGSAWLPPLEIRDVGPSHVKASARAELAANPRAQITTDSTVQQIALALGRRMPSPACLNDGSATDPCA